MRRKIECRLLKKASDGMMQAPYPSALGQWLYDHYSEEAWKMWIDHQTRLINESKLDPTRPKDRQKILDAMFAFLSIPKDQSF